MSDGPQDEQVATVAAAAATLAPSAEPAAPAAPAPAPAAAEAQPTAAPTPAIDKLASLFDELADRHITANADNKNAPFGISREMLADFYNRARISKDELAQLLSNPEEGAALAKKILYERVWLPMMGDKLPPQIAAIGFDIAFRRGQDRWGKTLQKAAKAVTGAALKIDGYTGRQTMLTLAQADVESLSEQLISHRGTLVWRIGDGKLFGHDINLARAAIFAGKWALRAKGIPIS